jgi:hypothetical protein
MITAEEKFQIICPECKQKFASQNKSACPKCNVPIEEMKNPTLLHYVYYHCTKRKNPNCTQKSIRVEKLDKETRAQLGEKGWLQEVLRDFLGAGDSYIPPDVINDLKEEIKDVSPIRMLFPEWNNREEAKEDKVKNETTWVRGALHIWKEPIPGREYIIGVDSAEGQGEESDNSCFEVIDQLTCEQVAEFYSNTCPIHTFTQILAMVAKTYETALVIAESQGPGLAVLSKLEHDFHYENIYSTMQGKKESTGIKTTKSNRPLFLETLHTRLINKSIIVKSKRFVKELGTFIYNKQTKRAEAEKGYHDDAIMAMSLAL